MRNRKVLNATKITVDGVRYDSKLEATMASLLKMFKIPFEHQVPFRIQQAFRYNGQSVQDIEMVVDFFLRDHNLIIDTKGFATDVSKLKIKMLKYRFHVQGESTRIELPDTKAACEKLINSLIANK